MINTMQFKTVLPSLDIFNTLFPDNSMCMAQCAACTTDNINRMLLRKTDFQGLYALEHELDGIYSLVCFLAQRCIILVS